MARAFLAWAFLIAAWAGTGPAQSQEPAFEFVSIRRSTPPETPAAGGVPVVRVLPQGRFEARNTSIEELVRIAYGFEQFDPRKGIVQTPRFSRLFDDRYDLTAVIDGEWSKPASGDGVPPELRVMLRDVLHDRFALKARLETKRIDVFALRLSGSAPGPSLRPSTSQCLGPLTNATPGPQTLPRCPFTFQLTRIEAGGVTLADVARLLWSMTGLADRPIVDDTGLEGTYDLTLVIGSDASRPNVIPEVRREDRPSRDPALDLKLRPVVIREALKAQLGLELKGAQLPVPTLVIESAKRPQED
jgi:uncharacterized protein (TIGR03435 family)